MDNDLPAEPNDYMAAAYAELAHQARLRAGDTIITLTLIRGVTMVVNRGDYDAVQSAAGKLQHMADLYAERRELTAGYRR